MTPGVEIFSDKKYSKVGFFFFEMLFRVVLLDIIFQKNYIYFFASIPLKTIKSLINEQLLCDEKIMYLELEIICWVICTFVHLFLGKVINGQNIAPNDRSFCIFFIF